MLGAGAWAANQLSAWGKVEGARIVALCDRLPDRLHSLGGQFGIERLYRDFGEMLARERLDFVDLCARPQSHASLIRQAGEHGLPVLCQKPFCTSLQEAEEIVASCEEAGVRLMINENYRWQAWYRKAKDLLEVGAIGAPFQAKIQERWRATLPHFESTQAYLAEMPRLILYEMGVHYLDVFRYLFGEPEAVTARLHHISPKVRGEDVQMILLNYPHLTGLIQSSWVSVPVPGLDTAADGRDPLTARLEIDGVYGTIYLEPEGTLHLYRDGEYEQWKFGTETEEESRASAHSHFINCLEEGTEFETSGRDTLKTMTVLWACYQSAQESRTVPIFNPS
jgi:predicted dehydrogenase